MVQENGSAKNAWLTPDRIGFKLAAKTGSADYHKGAVPPIGRPSAPIEDYNEKGMRKHTWLAGWFPAEEPRFVITVYVHDTSATASHSAAYVARKFLVSRAVQDLMEVTVAPAEGTPGDGAPAGGRAVGASADLEEGR